MAFIFHFCSLSCAFSFCRVECLWNIRSKTPTPKRGEPNRCVTDLLLLLLCRTTRLATRLVIWVESLRLDKLQLYPHIHTYACTYAWEWTRSSEMRSSSAQLVKSPFKHTLCILMIWTWSERLGRQRIEQKKKKKSKNERNEYRYGAERGL